MKEAFDRCLTDVFPNAWIGSFVEFEHPCKRGNQDDAQHERRRNTDDQRHPTERMGAMGTMSGAISTENPTMVVMADKKTATPVERVISMTHDL